MAAGAHSLLAVRPCFVTRLVTQMYFPNDPLMPFDPISPVDRRSNARAAAGVSLRLDLTEPEWALGYRFNFVLRGRDATPFEGRE